MPRRRNTTPKVTFEADAGVPRRSRASTMTRRKVPGTAAARPPSAVVSPPASILYKNSSNRPIVLHGRVVKDDKSSPAAVAGEQMQPPRRTPFFRENMERRSTLSKLVNETADFQKQVNNLEVLLREVRQESTTDMWRARNKIKTVLDFDKSLWEQLFEYEKRLTLGSYSDENADDVRAAQTACMKLHRDFKKSHKALVMALSLYETRQHGDVSQIGAVGWTGGKGINEEKEQKEEFRDTRFELKPVELFYQDPAEVSLEPQESFSSGVAAASDEVVTLDTEEKDSGGFGGFCGAVNCAEGWMDQGELHQIDSKAGGDEDSDDDDSKSQKPRKFRFPTDFETLKQEVLLVGKVLVLQGKHLDCGATTST